MLIEKNILNYLWDVVKINLFLFFHIHFSCNKAICHDHKQIFWKKGRDLVWKIECQFEKSVFGESKNYIEVYINILDLLQY